MWGKMGRDGDYMKVTAVAPSNIAFIKFWGKRNSSLNIPYNDSISINLDSVVTQTSVEFLPQLLEDEVTINGQVASEKEKQRVVKHLNLIRNMAKLKMFARVISENNFPKSAGIASSASGFAALSVAGSRAAGLHLSSLDLSRLARRGSGSASRSIPDGFVKWKKGTNDATSVAKSLYMPSYWAIADLIAVTTLGEKQISSTEGHDRAESSPFFKARIHGMPVKIRAIKRAIKQKNFSVFGKIIEEEAINMHTVMMTSTPPAFYWSPQTVEIFDAVWKWRMEGIESYFTLDAGPNVHIICEEKNVHVIQQKLKCMSYVQKVFIGRPGKGTRVLEVEK